MTATIATSVDNPEIPEITVFYDGACPLCRREISFYKNLNGADTIHWLDVTNCSDADIPEDVTRKQLLGRFHILTADKTAKSGAAAFVEIWRNLPAFRPLSYIARIPGAMPVLEFGYTLFLKFRPAIQNLFSTGKCPGPSHTAK